MRHADQEHAQDRTQNDGQVSQRVPAPRKAPTAVTAVEVHPEHEAAATAVVAEAVALASEEAAVEAVEAVLVTAVAVTQAAGRAADAAESAKEARAFAADAALIADEQDARTLDREPDPAEQHLATSAPTAHAPAGAQEVAEILAAAEERDSRAETRDLLAEERERAASLRAFLGDEHYEEYEQFAAGLSTRRAAALDRLGSKTDRAAAASDRGRLSDHLSRGPGAEEVGSGSSMTEIAAELSHDLRVPLSVIMGSVELLEDELSGQCEPTVAAHLSRAMRAGDRMVRMLDQNMASHSPGQPTTMLEVDLAEIVEQLVLDSAGLLEPVGAVVESGKLPVVRADPDEMYSVLQNLITNSVKFARPGVPAVVRISARPTEDGWRISVRDNGMGLPDNSGLDVFSLFSRGTSEVTGHGIGLATVARIVTTHGGRVGATPAEPGAEIWFELPGNEAGSGRAGSARGSRRGPISHA